MLLFILKCLNIRANNLKAYNYNVKSIWRCKVPSHTIKTTFKIEGIWDSKTC